jgi:hypothetical protein
MAVNRWGRKLFPPNLTKTKATPKSTRLSGNHKRRPQRHVPVSLQMRQKQHQLSSLSSHPPGSKVLGRCDWASSPRLPGPRKYLGINNHLWLYPQNQAGMARKPCTLLQLTSPELALGHTAEMAPRSLLR